MLSNQLKKNIKNQIFKQRKKPRKNTELLQKIMEEYRAQGVKEVSSSEINEVIRGNNCGLEATPEEKAWNLDKDAKDSGGLTRTIGDTLGASSDGMHLERVGLKFKIPKRS